MTNLTRIFVDPKSKTVIHAIEEGYTTLERTIEGLPPEKRITNISRFQLKHGSRQQSSGDDVFNTLMAGGNFVEVDEDSILIRKKLSEEELSKQAQHVAYVLGLLKVEDVDYLRKALRQMEDGQLFYENTEACETKPEASEEQQIDEGLNAMIRNVATEVIREFDENGYVDWRQRDSMLAKLRLTIRKKLKSVRGEFDGSVVQTEINQFLSTLQHA